jgi:hypothetical protein
LNLTPENKSAINQWNSIAGELTDSSFRHFFNPWFSNIRSLIKSNFPLHGIKELTDRLGKDFKTFTILGSGPSIVEIARRLPVHHEAIFCGPTALGTLVREGIRPTALIVADSNAEQYRHVLETKIAYPEKLDVVLSVTADPSWYDEDSVLNRDRLYFYLPYFDYMGDTNLGFNVILKSLFPDVPHWISQAGSVSNLMLNVADLCCNPNLSPDGGDPDKRIYIGVDNSWIKGGLTRAPLRFEREAYSETLQAFWDHNTRERSDTIEVPYKDEVVISDLVSIGYAINLFLTLNSWEQKVNCKNRYVLIDEASKLYLAIEEHSETCMPVVRPEYTVLDKIHWTKDEDHWAYKVMLGLIELSNRLHDRLREELTSTILHNWLEKPEIQNIVDVPIADFYRIRKDLHEIQPSIKFLFNGQEIEEI